jgi:hypothetical protein
LGTLYCPKKIFPAAHQILGAMATLDKNPRISPRHSFRPLQAGWLKKVTWQTLSFGETLPVLPNKLPLPALREKPELPVVPAR